MKRVFLTALIINLLVFVITDKSEAKPAYDIATIELDLDIETIPNLLISDAFAPMTHYSSGDIRFSMSPVYLKLPLGSSKSIDSEYNDLTCKAVSFTAGYAFTDRLAVNLLYTYADITGTVGHDKNGSPLVRVKGDQEMQFYLAAVEYDLIESETNSLPIMGGIGQKSVNLKMDVNGTYYPSDCIVESDSDSLFFFLGIAYSKKITISGIGFKMTPYLYYLQGDSSEYSYSSESTPSFNYRTNGIDTDSLVDGFHFDFIFDGLSVGLSVNSEFANYYYHSFDNLFLEGLYMLYVGVKEFAYTATVSYTF